MNIERYKASKPMQTVFITNADGCGDHIFTQIKRDGNVAIYSRTDCGTNKVVGYEVIVISTVKAGTVYVKGGKPTEHDTESYPGAKSFGKSGWSCASLEQAEKKFSVVVKDQEPEVTYTIPAEGFTLVDFATANSLPVSGDTAKVISGLIAEKKVVFIGKNVKGLQTFKKG